MYVVQLKDQFAERDILPLGLRNYECSDSRLKLHLKVSKYFDGQFSFLILRWTDPQFK